jgi:hypothetical protein
MNEYSFINRFGEPVSRGFEEEECIWFGKAMKGNEGGWEIKGDASDRGKKRNE